MPSTSSSGPPRLLVASDIDATARLLASSFDDDPAYSYLFPSPPTRAAGLADFFRGHLATHLPFGCTFVATERGAIIATVTLRPPEGVPVSPITMLRNGLLPFALRHGAAAVGRLFALKRAYDDLERAASEGRAHWHVHMMVVHPAQQGRGVGSRLLASVLAHAIGARARERHPIVLTTHKERNVTFYRRAGFEVVNERPVQVDLHAAPYHVWSMSRKTHPAEGAAA